MRYYNRYKNELMCSVCGEIITEIQSNGIKPRLFKVVEKECPKCNKKRKFIVIQDLETAKHILSNQQYMSLPQSIVYNLIQEKENDQKQEKKKIK